MLQFQEWRCVWGIQCVLNIEVSSSKGCGQNRGVPLYAGLLCLLGHMFLTSFVPSKVAAVFETSFLRYIVSWAEIMVSSIIRSTNTVGKQDYFNTFKQIE